jgi:hypothetical protein
MARISTYVKDTNIVAADKWIGSDSQNKFQTKNFTAGDVAEFINKKGLESQLFRYKYDMINPSGVPRPIESITFENGGAFQVPLSTINSIVLSNYAQNQGGLSVDVSTWYTAPLIDSDILLTQCDDITNWAIYKWDSAVLDSKDNTFTDVGLTYTAGNGSLTDKKDYFISLLQYAGGSGDKNEVSAQLTNVTGLITVTHNLNKFCSVTVSEGTPTSPSTIVNCGVEYMNLNQVRLSFDSNVFTGVVVFN